MAILKKLLIAAAFAIFVVAVAIAVGSYFIPSERSFTNEIEINAPAEKVWQVITDRERYTEWQNQLERVEIIDSSSWIEYPKNSPEPLKFRLADDKRPTRMEFEYAMGDAMKGHWSGDLTPTSAGVRLRTVDSYKTDGWLMKMLMGAFFDLDSFAKDWNSKLKQRAETLK